MLAEGALVLFTRGSILMVWFGALALLGSGGCADGPMSDPSGTVSNQANAGKADTLHHEEQQSAGPPQLARQYALSVDSWIELLSGPNDDDPEGWEAAFFALIQTGENDSGELFVEAAPCAMVLPEVKDRKVESSDETLQRAVSSLTPADVVYQDGVYRLVTQRDALLAGVDLDNRVLDPMPTSKRDARLVDIDGDRKPGMTLRISGFKVYVAMRYTYMLDGVVGADGIIEGDADVLVDLEVYGDNVPFVDISESFDRSFGKLELTAERHRFRMVPLEDTVSTCRDIPDGLMVPRPQDLEQIDIEDASP